MSINRGGLMNKLKEGLQEAVVFLRTLGDFKIPAVMERRRKELLERLTNLQGDSIKETPPIIEPTEDKKPEPKAAGKPPAKADNAPAKADKAPAKADKAPAKDDAEGSVSSSSSSTVTSPSHGQGKIQRRDSKVVMNRIKDYESIHFSAKKEEELETPKRLVTLKRVSKPQDFPSANSPTPEPEPAEEKQEKEEAKEETKEEAKDAEMDKLEVDGVNEREGSLLSAEGVLDGEEETGKKKKKNKRGFGGGLKVKARMKREKSPGPERKHPPAAEEEAAEEPAATENGEEPEPEALEKGVRVKGILEERRKKGLGGTKKVKMEAKVHETTLVLEGKENLELANCSVDPTDIGFDLTHPQHKSAIVFKVEGGAEEKMKWLAALKDAIAEATPPAAEVEEEKEAEEGADSGSQLDIPSITVEPAAAASPSQPSKNKKDAKSLSSTMKPEKKLLPDQGVAMKGYMYRKKPGLGKSWEKTYCVLTYQAMYFTTMEDKKDYSSMLPIFPDSEGKLSETKKGKGHDKHCQVPGLALKLGKKLEQFSLESQGEFREWKEAIERVLGIGGVEELLSEDEEEDGAPAIEEDLYEELEPDYIPPVPDSPRPARPALPQMPSADDDIMIDEDIYEETDDILPSQPSPAAMAPSPLASAAPTLPDRNLTKKHTTSPPPSLPPRGAGGPPAPVPNLPPRGAGGAPIPNLPPRNQPKPKAPPSPQDYEATTKKAPAPIPTTAPEDEELYDDVVTGGGDAAEIDETYDDVVVGGGAEEGEELYDDILATTSGAEPIQDENYEDMAPGQIDSYVTMEKKEAEEPDELYVDVEEPASHTHSPSVSRKGVPPKQQPHPKTGTFSRMFHKKATPDHKGKGGISGALSYKAPKKSKFEEKWGVIEGNQLAIHKSSSDKRAQDKIPLSECRLELGSTEAGAGKFAFHLIKGEKYHHFSLKEATDLETWVGVVKGLVKYAPVEVPGGSGSGSVVSDEEHVVFQAKEDHIAERDSELTFKRGTFIRLIRKESPGLWVGQIGNSDQVFEGKIGEFPPSKVEEAEELYAN